MEELENEKMVKLKKPFEMHKGGEVTECSFVTLVSPTSKNISD